MTKKLRKSLDEQFEEFHAAHPDVWQLFRRFATQIRDQGSNTYGAKSIMERIRWHYATSSQGTETFKINNNFTSRYVRKMIEADPSYETFFETRKLLSKKKFVLAERLAELGFENLDEYRRGDWWIGFRGRYYVAKPAVCFITGLTTNLDLHHITYVRLGAEWFEDVVPIYKPWHHFIHEHLIKKHKVKLEEAHLVAKKCCLLTNKVNELTNPSMLLPT